MKINGCIFGFNIRLFFFQRTRFTAYMLWAKEVRQDLLEKCPYMGKKKENKCGLKLLAFYQSIFVSSFK